MCVMFDPPNGLKKGALVGPCEASRALEDLAVVLLLHVRCAASYAVKRSNKAAVLLLIRHGLSLHAVKKL